MPDQNTFQKRQVAYKVRIANLLEGSFEKDELMSAFLRIGDLKISRVNIIGTIVHVSKQENHETAAVDDGTGRIALRTFDNSDVFSKVDVGDVTLIVGKVREFNNERYIIPEIIKILNNLDWINARKLELEASAVRPAETKKPENSQSLFEETYGFIKKLDYGDGASVEEILKMNPSAEDVIKKLLEKGDVFEVKPGMLKVLE